HRPARRQEHGRVAVRDPPADGEADRAAQPARGPAPGARLVGFLDALFGGGRKLKGPAPDRLFAMTTAQITLEVELGLRHRDVAGIVFQPLATSDFKEILTETDELLRGAAEDTGTEVEEASDEFGYRWVILRDP